MNFSRAFYGFGAVLAAATLMGCVAASGDGTLEGSTETDGPEPATAGNDALGANATVAEAVSGSCSTTSVKGLSLQIIEMGRCIQPAAYDKIPDLPNVSFGSAAFPYLESPARDALVAALEAHPGRSMTVNSMLRTIAQQYLLYAWYQDGRCGIGLAAHPSKSNHETGLAFDTNEASAWRSSLSAQGFKWFGSADPVHFDYVGSGSVNYKGLDVQAFQRLWNVNHPEDKISEDGDWGPQTESRMRKAPANGFAQGADCN